MLGFEIAYQRPEQGFAYLERPEGAQIMLCQRSGNWETPLGRPFGRGVMFQIYVEHPCRFSRPIRRSLASLRRPSRFGGSRYGDREGGKREIFVQDPDGYLIMIAEDLGERPL